MEQLGSIEILFVGRPVAELVEYLDGLFTLGGLTQYLGGELAMMQRGLGKNLVNEIE